MLACLLAASTWRVYSNTWDEPEHLAAGIELLDLGRYEYDTEHPPIVRALMALGPYLAGARSFGTPPPDGVLEGQDILYGGGHYQLYLTLARLGTLPFLAVLLFATWLWARRLSGSEGEALLAVLLLVAVPPVLGHGALASLDVAAAATVLLALYAIESWLSSVRWHDAVFAGLTAGVAVGCKFSAIPFLALGFGVLAVAHWVLGPRRSQDCVQALDAGIASNVARAAYEAGAADGGGASAGAGASGGGGAADSRGPGVESDVGIRRRLGGFAVVLATSVIPLWLAYGLWSANAVTLPHRFDLAVRFLLQEQGLSHSAGVLLGSVWLPSWVRGLLEGIIAVKAHNDSGHLSFLMGELRSTGWWYFYLVGLAVKTPLPLLATGPVGMVFLAREGWRARDVWRLAPALLFLTVLIFASAFSHINIGIRHVLVLYPFMALGGAHLIARAWRSLRRMVLRPVAIVGSAFLMALVTWHVSTLWSAHPDYLPYFNEVVAHPQRVLVDSDLDWGQDLRRLEKRAAEMKIPRLNLAYRGTAVPAREPLPPYIVLPPWKHVTGWVAISWLAKVHDPRGYAWLDAYEPVELVGRTILLYYIPQRR